LWRGERMCDCLFADGTNPLFFQFAAWTLFEVLFLGIIIGAGAIYCYVGIRNERRKGRK